MLEFFVDDLDRCLPENAIQVLEAIKLYLDRTNITFVIGAEQAVISKRTDAARIGNDTSSFFDRLFMGFLCEFVILVA